MTNSNSQTDDEYILHNGITTRLFDSQKDIFRHIEMYEAAYDEEGHYVDNIVTDQAQIGLSRICAIDKLSVASGGFLCKSCVLRERERDAAAQDRAIDHIIFWVGSTRLRNHLTKKLLKCRELRYKNHSRTTSRFIHNCTLKLFDSTCGISSTTGYKCEGVGKCGLLEFTSPANLGSKESTRG